MPTIALSAIQMCSSSNQNANLKQLNTLLNSNNHTSAHVPRLIVLPENFISMGHNDVKMVAEQFDNVKLQLSTLAQIHNCWLVSGTLPCPYRPNGTVIPHNKVRATCLVFDPSGTLVGRYDKIHLFDAQVADTVGSYRESDTYEAGNTITTVKTPFGNIGLMVCYDLRFPELALQLRQLNSSILAVPSAFTFATGQKHWNTLISARALDAQCVLVAANQSGERHGRVTWGHSSIVNADGVILSQLSQHQPDVSTIQWDDIEQNKLRQQLPTHSHRRL